MSRHAFVMHIADSPFHLVPATPVINNSMPPQRSPEEASVPSLHADQPETPVAQAPVVFRRERQWTATIHQETEQTPVQHIVPHAEYNQNRSGANRDVIPCNCEVSEQVVPCLPSPKLMTTLPVSTLSDSAGTSSAPQYYLTGRTASRQCILQKRLLMYSCFLKSEAERHSQRKSQKYKQINLFVGNKIFG